MGRIAAFRWTGLALPIGTTTRDYSFDYATALAREAFSFLK